MRENVRNVSRGRAGRERWEFALDSRQIAAVAVGALVVVGSSFVLGMNMGKGAARRASAPVAATSLDAFDTAHANLPAPPEPKSWEYEKLGGSRAADAAAHLGDHGPVGASAQARVPPPARPLARPSEETPTSDRASAQVPAPAAPAATVASAQPSSPASASVAPAPAPAPALARPPPAAAPAPSAMDRALAAVGGAPAPAAERKATDTSGSGYVIQIGASSNKSEAERIAKRFASRGARVLAADVDGKRWYRVRLATYGSRPEAERALSSFARETGVRGFVTAAR